MARRRSTDQLYALKMLEKSSRTECIQHEIRVLEELRERCQDSVFVEVVDHGSISSNGVFMVTKLLGPSLFDLHQFCQFRVSVNTSVQVGIKMLDLVERLHESGYVHNDIKPENIVTSLDQPDNFIMIDMGFASPFLDPETGEHIQEGRSKNSRGTPFYASLGNHNGQVTSRRDDMQSLNYMVLKFMYPGLLERNFKTSITGTKRKIIEIL